VSRTIPMERDGNKLVLSGPDGAVRIAALTGKLVEWHSTLRMHESALVFAEQALERLPQHQSKEPEVAEALLIAAVTRFFSCFGQNRAARALNAKKIYRNHDGAYVAYTNWKAIRDKHFVHNESTISAYLTAAALDATDLVVEVLALQFTPNYHMDIRWCDLLLNLVRLARQYASHEADQLSHRICIEENQKPPAHRAALPDLQYVAPHSSAAFTTRANPT
jgi:hypothetical protein